MMKNNTNNIEMFRYVSEQMVEDLVCPEALQDVIENVFAEMSVQKAKNFPVVREQLGYAAAVRRAVNRLPATRALSCPVSALNKITVDW